MIRTRKSRAVAALVAGALVIAACGGDDDDSGDDAGTAEPADEPADDGGDEPADDGGEEPADDGGDEPADDGGDEPADDGGEEPASEMDDSDMAPQRGGVLTYLLEAESDTWDIPGANCAAACITVMRAVADPMLIVNSDNELEPFLVESFDVNDDFTEWTFTMRPGVTFHDGTPVDGAALQKNLIEMASGTLQGQVFWDLANGSLFSDPPGSPADSIELVDDMTVKVSFAVPVATFGYALAERTGWVFAPSFWDNPDRAGALAVSTGPFMMTEQVRGEVTRTVANPNYWRTDANGEALPYLDGVDFRPVPDSDARLATMQAGDAELNQDSAGENTEFWELEWTETDGNGIAPKGEDREVNYLMFNHAKPPFDNVDFRRAVALCTDRQEVIDFRAPASEVQDGPFAPGAAGYVEDPGFPQFDPDAGNALLDEIGRQPIVYGTTNAPMSLVTAELFQEMWSENCGLEVSIDQFEQSELITKALTNDFEVFAWRNHGQGNPGLEYVWWHSRHAAGLALNFGRIIDPELDALLEETRSTLDPAVLDEVGQRINQQFAAEVHNLWLNPTEWQNPYRAGVHNVGHITLESGNEVQGQLAGRIWIHEAWMEN